MGAGRSRSVVRRNFGSHVLNDPGGATHRRKGTDADSFSHASDVDIEGQLDLGSYVPFYVRAIANRLGAAASNSYKQEFGIGLSEWSCLAALAVEGETSASHICAVSGYDKGLISRSLSALETKTLVAGRPSAEGGRRRLMRMTPEGERIYLAICKLALAREERLLDGMSPDDRRKLRGILKKMHRNAIAIAGDADA